MCLSSWEKTENLLDRFDSYSSRMNDELKGISISKILASGHSLDLHSPKSVLGIRILKITKSALGEIKNSWDLLLPAIVIWTAFNIHEKKLMTTFDWQLLSVEFKEPPQLHTLMEQCWKISFNAYSFGTNYRRLNKYLYS